MTRSRIPPWPRTNSTARFFLRNFEGIGSDDKGVNPFRSHGVEQRPGGDFRNSAHAYRQNRLHQCLKSNTPPMSRWYEFDVGRPGAEVPQQVTVSETPNRCEFGWLPRIVALDQHRKVVAASIECIDRIGLDLLLSLIVLLAGTSRPFASGCGQSCAISLALCFKVLLEFVEARSSLHNQASDCFGHVL